MSALDIIVAVLAIVGVVGTWTFVAIRAVVNDHRRSVYEKAVLTDLLANYELVGAFNGRHGGYGRRSI